ncbi:MAG: PorV/PorQ family protein [Candidatus Latescibacter sp.]|nr:PorV/PorQ family protein [Candidatus Latescibacter sp.]
MTGGFSFCPATFGRSINDGIGTTGFVWLKAVSDAEVSAAGECIAARDGTAGILVHPAAIVTGMDRGTMKLSYVSHFVDTQYGSIGYANKIKDHYLGVRVTYVNYGDFIATNSSGDRTGSFTAGDMGISFNIGKQPREDLKIGATVSYLTSKIQDFTAQAATLDLGAIYTPPFEGLTVGAMLMNVGKVLSGYSSSYTDKLPLYLTVGVRKSLQHSPFTLMADVTFPNDSDISFAFGVEANINDRFFLYGGTRSRSDVDLLSQKSKTNFSGVRTMGFGLNLDRYRFNYAYYPNNDLDNVHKITLSAQIF